MDGGRRKFHWPEEVILAGVEHNLSINECLLLVTLSLFAGGGVEE